MDTNKTALNQCLVLSQNINKLGLGINSKRYACETFSQLVQSSANLGALVTAVDYVPSREYRLNLTVDAMKEVSKVIYLLNVANGSDAFIGSEVAACIDSAIKVSELLNGILAEYGKPARKPEPKPAAPVITQPKPQPKAQPVEEVEAVEDDEDGFDEPFED